jgi:1-phosphofructokinase family hexose kinase
VGANLTVDRTLRMTRLVPGNVMRPSSAMATAGGKAVNVCRASRAHGVRPRLVANLPGRLGAVVGDLLDEEGHDVRRVVTAGEIRSAIVIIEDDGRATVLNEPGPELSRTDRAAFLDAVAEEGARRRPDGSPAHRVAVASGSLPPGAVAADLYAEVVARCRATGLQVVLDAARTDLRLALPAAPDVVTPNLSEALAVLTGESVGEAVEPDVPDLRAAALDAAHQLCSAGARAALVTVGRHGVAGCTARRSFWVAAPTVSEVNPIGAGDSFAAGLGCGLEQGLDLPGATRLAVATGAASVASELAGGVDPQVLARLLEDPALVVQPVPAGVTR